MKITKEMERDLIVWIAEYAYKMANPKSKMDVPSIVYEQVEKDVGRFLGNVWLEKKNEVDLEKQIDELAKFIMKEFGTLMIGEGAIEMAIRLLNEYKYRDGVVGKDPSGKEIKK